MPRATNAPASRERRKRVVDRARGFRGRRSKLFRYAKDATMKAKYWAYRDRKTKKRNFRMLWVQRLPLRQRTLQFKVGRSRFGVERSCPHVPRARTTARHRAGRNRRCA